MQISSRYAHSKHFTLGEQGLATIDRLLTVSVVLDMLKAWTGIRIKQGVKISA